MTTPALALHTLRDGFGIPVVLLHAFPLDHRMWIDLAAALPGAPTVLAVDLPGFGGSREPSATPSLEAAADAIAAALGPRGRVVIAGVSMGGYVALALAERHPRLVAGLALLDSKSTADDAEARANRLRIAGEIDAAQTVGPVLGMAGVLVGASSRAARPELTARIEGWIRGQRPAGVSWSQRAMAARPDRTSVLARLHRPVLIGVGQEDLLTPRSDAEHMAASAVDAQLEVIPRAGHLAVVEAPETVAKVLAPLMARSAG